MLSHSSVFDGCFEPNRKDTELIKPFSLTAAYANKLRRAKESQSSQRNKT